MQEFRDDDLGYLRWVQKNPRRLRRETFRRPRPTYLILHSASCRLITGTLANGSRWTADYVKFCGTEAELRRWARRDVGGDVRECPRCL